VLRLNLAHIIFSLIDDRMLILFWIPVLLGKLIYFEYGKRLVSDRNYSINHVGSTCRHTDSAANLRNCAAGRHDYPGLIVITIYFFDLLY
jgi:hypothetical protein